MSTPKASVVLRRLADEAVRRWAPQQLSQQQMGGGQWNYGPVMSESQRTADDTARTCAHSHAASLRAVADEFEKAEAEDDRRFGAIIQMIDNKLMASTRPRRDDAVLGTPETQR
jgi:hypothetical protein